ncbi:MAG: hypothetical protein K0S38_733 [Candidatus Paceibacter sp.]|jgi:hypothetical protein|nr:hypothetical protein [Candidatus Paceibacter sp.]
MYIKDEDDDLHFRLDHNGKNKKPKETPFEEGLDGEDQLGSRQSNSGEVRDIDDLLSQPDSDTEERREPGEEIVI